MMTLIRMSLARQLQAARSNETHSWLGPLGVPYQVPAPMPTLTISTHTVVQPDMDHGDARMRRAEPLQQRQHAPQPQIHQHSCFDRAWRTARTRFVT